MMEEKERKDLKSLSSNSNNKNKNDVLNQKNTTSNPLPAGHKCSMEDCVLSQSTQIMWGYPVRLANTTSFTPSSSTSNNTDKDAPSSSSGVDTTSSSSLSLSLPPSTSDTSSSSSLLDKRSREDSHSEEGSDPKKVRTGDSAKHSSQLNTNVEESSSSSLVSKTEEQEEKEVEKAVVLEDVMEITVGEKYDTGVIEGNNANINININDDENKISNDENETDVSINKNMFDDSSSIGVRAGIVPSKKETCTIFNQTNHISTETTNRTNSVSVNHINHINGATSSQDSTTPSNTTTSPPSSSSSSSSSSPASLLFPSFSVSIKIINSITD